MKIKEHLRAVMRLLLTASASTTGLLISTAAGGPLYGVQSEPAPVAEESAPCDSEEHRQFDFWIGSWRVQQPDGSIAGTNEIRRILGGCVLQERWEGARGMSGTSFNTYYAGRWHQTWVDDRGGLLLLDGGLEGKSMVLRGTMASRQDVDHKVRHEIRWTPLDGGRVRQLWRTSSDDGKTWDVVFDGLYVPAGESPSGAAE